MPGLMATAEYVTKVHAVCVRTGNLAHYSYRKTADEKQVMLGEKQEYEPLSRAAFNEAMKKMAEKTIGEIAQIIEAQIHLYDEKVCINRLLLDSRQYSSADGVLFFALRGNNHDGHQYISELLKRASEILW